MGSQFRSFLAVCSIAASGVLSGCAAAIHEKHYFASVAPATAASPARLVNIFRVDVHAQGGLANVRYLAGNYDERAVDYFLNETKSKDYSGNDGKSFPPIWNLSCPKPDDSQTKKDECKDAYNEALRVIPLTAGANGPADSFVIILSTNANAIAETIGAISENTATIQSLIYLLNQDTFEAKAQIDAAAPKKDEHRKELVKLLDAQLQGYEADTTAGAARELAILKILAAELSPDGPIAFQTLEEAKIWFANIR